MAFTFTPTNSTTANSFLARSAHHLELLSATARRGWFASWIPAIRNKHMTGDVDAFAKSLTLITLQRWADECAIEDEWIGQDSGDDDDCDDDRRYGSFEDQNRLRVSELL